MKIGWMEITDEIIGGAEITNRLWLKNKPEEIDIINIYSEDETLPECDLYILHHIKTFSPYILYNLLEQEYIYCSHDVLDINIPVSSIIINNSKKNIYLSPAHRDYYQDDNGICIPPPLEINKYEERTGEGIIYLGRYEETYGMDRIALWADNHEETIDCYGWGEYEPVGKYINNHGRVSQEEVPDVLSKYNKFIFLPDVLTAFSRSTAEAKLSGCQLICNNNVGALSYNWDKEEWRDNLSKSSDVFWSTIVS